MIEFLLLVVSLVGIGFALGWYGREVYAKRVVAKFSDSFDRFVKERIIEIEITKTDYGYLVHHQRSGEFIVQGVSHNDISKKLSELYPGYVFSASEKNLAEVGYPGHDTV